MHISLDNITFYSHPPPAKSPPRAFSVSRWKPYETPLAPQTLSHTPLPRLPSPRTTTTLASDAASARLWGPVRAGSGLRPVRNEFDIEIERMSMAETEKTAHETDLDMHPDSGPRNGNVTDMAQAQRTSSATEHPDRWMCSLAEAVGDSDPAFIPAESYLHQPGPPVALNDRMGMHQDGTTSLRTCDETDRDSTPPEVTSPCERIFAPPSPDLMGNVRHSPAEPGADAVMCDESVMDITNSTPEDQGDRAGDREEMVATIEGVHADSPLVREASLDDNERRKSSDESQATGSPCLRSQSRLIKQSRVPLTSTRSLRPRASPGSTRPERLPSVSVVIPTRRTGQSVASSKTKRPARAQRYGHWSGSDSGNPNDGQATQASMEDYSPFPGRSSPKARGRPRKRPKRGRRNNSASTNNIVGGFTSQSQNRSNGGSAVTPGKTQEIFGRGVLRIQSHGPRNAYFMTFLPEVSPLPSPPPPSKMPPNQSSYADDTSKDESLQPVALDEIITKLAVSRLS
ncbi:hypothetical protein N7492_000905 [Penicillium capsulatum]|uniref:Uncharacterized protein n=1 Tax=Penicillium capsulatum TaxID=69766 RepID=A0A9W9ISQ0_9EURO|nr:hypothetical protein N7492_000905 [Penicillium capsulatum]KAJ6130037.1 hypothetical protein N7512_002817 [Penicillium capsulatum]